MIDIIQEVTDWGPGQKGLTAKNGIYWIDQKTGWLLAHQANDGEKRIFKKPMKKFSKSRRKFKKLGVTKSC